MKNYFNYSVGLLWYSGSRIHLLNLCVPGHLLIYFQAIPASQQKHSLSMR